MRDACRAQHVRIVSRASCEHATASSPASTQVLDAASANRTTVLVAHKLRSVVNADLILVMTNGRLVEQGTHAQLLGRPESTYARMWLEQTRDNSALFDGETPDYCKLALDSSAWQGDPDRPLMADDALALRFAQDGWLW